MPEAPADNKERPYETEVGDSILFLNASGGKNRHERLARLHGRHGEDWSSLHSSDAWQRAVTAINSYDDAPLLDMDM